MRGVLLGTFVGAEPVPLIRFATAGATALAALLAAFLLPVIVFKRWMGERATR